MRTTTLLFLTLMITTFSISAQDKISCEELTQLVAKDLAIWNDRTPERAGEIYHKDCISIGDFKGLQGRIESITKTLAANPKLVITAKDIICGDDVVTVHFESSGYNTKFGVEFNTTGIYSVYIKDGKFWKMSSELDILTPLMTAGYMLTPPKGLMKSSEPKN